MSLGLNKIVATFLEKNCQQKFTARDIAEWIFKNYPKKCRAKQLRSTAIVTPLTNNGAFIQQLNAEIGAQRIRLQKKYPQIKTTEGRPRKYYYSGESDSSEIDKAEDNSKPTTLSSPAKIREHDLYPLLTYFLWNELGLYSKRIDEKRAKNSFGPGGNKWLFPDIVAMEDLSCDWSREIKDCVGQYANTKTLLWSFEVKILINRSNVREVFFQTLSNSSWANFSYLVANEIEGVHTIKELRILSSLHGIGFIRLDSDNPSESQIIIPARERPQIDWATANRLAIENGDFLHYIKLVRQFYQTGDVRIADWETPVLPDI